MNLKAGSYLTRTGKVVNIVEHPNGSSVYPWKGDNGHSYTNEGKLLSFMVSPWDIVAHNGTQEQPVAPVKKQKQKVRTFNVGEIYHTRGGGMVKILELHAAGDHPMLVLCMKNNYSVRRYNSNGRWLLNETHKNDIV
jgi:hypothetical protein